jgi:hypothetical protein
MRVASFQYGGSSNSNSNSNSNTNKGQQPPQGPMAAFKPIPSVRPFLPCAFQFLRRRAPDPSLVTCESSVGCLCRILRWLLSRRFVESTPLIPRHCCCCSFLTHPLPSFPSFRTLSAMGALVGFPQHLSEGDELRDRAGDGGEALWHRGTLACPPARELDGHPHGRCVDRSMVDRMWFQFLTTLDFLVDILLLMVDYLSTMAPNSSNPNNATSNARPCSSNPIPSSIFPSLIDAGGH